MNGAFYGILEYGTFDVAYVFRINFPIRATSSEVGDITANTLTELNNLGNNFLQHCDIVTKEDFDRAYYELPIFNG